MATAITIWVSFSVVLMSYPSYVSGTAGPRPPPEYAAGAGSPDPAPTCGARQLGQEFSMLSSASLVLSPVIHAVISFQKVPAPTALGIWSEPSKRKTDSGSWKISADFWSIGLDRLATSRPVL